jgi:surfactin synthase thioesterase subunit
MYHPWRSRHAEHARVRPVELPGHGSRRGEPPVGGIGELTRLLAGELAADVDGPYVLYGHSFGALLAFELAHRLAPLAGPPAALVVSGRNAPRTPHLLPPLHDAPARQLLSGLRALEGGLPFLDEGAGSPESPELLDLFLPLLRTDLRMAETYVHAGLPRLTCPVHVFAGDLDPVVDAAGLAAWDEETDGTCRVSVVRGGHMMLGHPELHACLDSLLAVGAR